MNHRFRKFVSYYRPYLGLLLTDLACAFILSAITLALPLCTRYITKTVLEGNMPNALNQIYLMGALMLGLVAVHAACNMFVDYQGHAMGARMEGDMRNELFAHYQKLSFGFYDDQNTGQLMTRITNDPWSLTELFHHGPEDLAIALVTLVGALVILAKINLKLTLIVSLFLPVVAAYAFYSNAKMNTTLRVSKDRIGELNEQVEDTLAGMRVVQSFANEGLEIQKFARANRRYVQSRKDGYRSEAYFSVGMIAFTHLITVAVIIFGGASIVNASLDLADLLTFSLYIGLLIGPIQSFAKFAQLYQEGITGFDRVMEILEVEPDIKDAPDATELTRVRGEIQLRDASFKYKGGHDYVLKNLSLDIKAGEFVALVGSSGVGKTTLCSLIPRFYDVSEGAVLLDGRDVRGISLRSLRGNIGVVQQDVYLFSGTVAENIRYGKPNATDNEIIEAAKQANAHDFIMSLPDGYETDIGQRGVKLSGGQKQRLSIARVFLKDPPVLIMDEATSSLDNESEKAVQASLEKLTHDRTTIVIAHRLSTIRNAQRIVVLTDNGIEEQGTHYELMTRGGAYAALYNVQVNA